MPSVNTAPAPRSHPFHRRHKNAILLVTLLLLILFSPLLQMFDGSKLLDMLLTSLIISASLNTIPRKKPAIFFWAISIAALALISGWSHAINLNESHETHSLFQILAHFFGALLYIYIATLLFRTILHEKKVSADQIFAGVAIYIFIGLTWAHFYGLCDIFQKNSITGDIAIDSDFVYFSFVTLTTLGYGDMLPATAMTKALVIVESITGVMFVTILVSALVGRFNMRR